jgi:hypothetical protein
VSSPSVATPPGAPATVRRAPLPLERTAAALRRGEIRPTVKAADDWPHTTRVLPWMLAGFIAILWLVPFDAITLSASLPIDLHFDRLVLPFVVLVWILSLALGGRHAPRLRLTPIHVGVGVFVALAFVSVLINARALNQTLELDLAIKKLTLVVSYAALFVLVASVVRRSEVRAFMMYTLALAVVCALGTIWEYRFQDNLFYSWSDKLLPGIFRVQLVDASGVDDIGRRVTRGPATLGLECAAMLSMALPIAMVGVMHATRWRQRILFGLAACLVLAAAISTYRKTAFMAPIAVVLSLAFFRRRELLRLAPLGIVTIIAVHVLSPGAFGAIIDQLNPSRLESANTVNDRAADYDALRPDLFSHVLFGRGFGSYEQIRYRILDSELLHRTVEMGLLGLASYVLMIVAVVFVAAPLIRGRDPVFAPLALTAAAVAVAFLTVSGLFDAMSFSHTPYIFLCFAGLMAVLVKPPEGAS